MLKTAQPPPTVRLSFAQEGSHFRLISSSLCPQISEQTAECSGKNFQRIVKKLEESIPSPNPLSECPFIEAELTQDNSSYTEPNYQMKLPNEGHVLTQDQEVILVLLNYRYVMSLSGGKHKPAAVTNPIAPNN